MDNISNLKEHNKFDIVDAICKHARLKYWIFKDKHLSSVHIAQTIANNGSNDAEVMSLKEKKEKKCLNAISVTLDKKYLPK